MFRSSAFIMAALLSAVPADAAETVGDLLASASRGGHYMAPDADELQQAEALFLRCFSDCTAPEVRQGWQALGFDLIEVDKGGETVVVIREKEGARSGRGFYLLRPQSASTTALQAPHSFKDLHTRDILLHLLDSGDFRAAAWNSVPRNHLRNGMSVDADMAHLQESYFLAFGRAFAHRFSGGKLVQLHGFAQSKRRTAMGATAEVIISSGSRQTTATVREMGGCLKDAGFGNVRIYPLEARELGATTNSSGKALRFMGYEGFVHIEMSAPFRLKLLNNSVERCKLLRCLEE